jgi:hypothetical protein
MNIVKRLTDDTMCDQCDRLCEAGELFVISYTAVPLSCDAGTDMVPVLGTCARCCKAPKGFQPGWDLYGVSQLDLLSFAKTSILEAAENGASDLETASALRKLESIGKHLHIRIDGPQGPQWYAGE